MAKDIKRRFTVNLDIDTKDAEKQIKATVGNLKTVLADLGNASDKMSYFKELADYLQQVDAELSRLKTKHGDEFFNQFFGSLDKNLRTEMEKVFGTAQAQLTQLEQIRNRLSNVRALGDTDEARTEIKALEQEVRNLFTTLGKADEVKLSGRGKLETRLANMEAALDKFALVWDSVNDKIQQGVNFGGTGIDDGSGNISESSDEIQREIDKLKNQKNELQQTLDALNGQKIKINVDSKTSISDLEKLLDEYAKVRKIMDSADYRNSSGLYKDKSERDKIYAERIKLANMINSMNDYMLEEGNDAEAEFASSHYQQIDAAISYLERFSELAKKETVEIRKLYEGLILDVDDQLNKLQSGSGDGGPGSNIITTYDQLKQKVKEYIQLEEKISSLPKDSGERDSIMSRQEEIQDEIQALKELDEAEEDLFYGVMDDMTEPGANVEELAKRLCEIFQIDIPNSTQATTGAMGTVVDKMEYIQNLASQLEKLFNNINSMSGTLEYKILINGQEIDIKRGGDKTVSTQNVIESYLGTLNKNSIVSAHNHPGGTSSNFNAIDLRSTMEDVYGGAAQLGAIISEQDITTLNLAGVELEDALNVLKQIEAMNVNSVSADKINELFTALNPNYQNIAQVWDPSQFQQLAKFIYDVGVSANTTIDPLTKFQNILKIVTQGKIDLSKYASLFSDFKIEDAGSIFNQIMSKEGMDLRVEDLNVSSLSDFINEVNKHKNSFVELRNEADVTYSHINDLVKNYLATGGIDSDIDGFITQYFDRQDATKISDWLIELENGEASINQITNRIAEHFQQIDPSEYLKDDFSNVTEGFAQTGQTVVDVSEKVKAFLALTKQAENELFMSSIDNVEIGKYLNKLDEAKKEIDELGNQGLITAEELTAINDAFDNAQMHLKDRIVGYTGYGNGYYHYSYQDEYEEAKEEAAELRAELERVNQENEFLSKKIGDIRKISDEYEKRVDILEAQNAELEEQLELQQQLASQVMDTDDISDDDLADIQRENGSLEQRLDILRDIADAYGMQITQKERNRYEELENKDNDEGLTSREQERFDELADSIYEADEKLLELEETYERIIVTLSNGKKLEILPNDKGLRDLYKISDESGTYNGFDIEDIQFVRQEQFLKTQISSYEELCDVVKRLNELRIKDRTGKEELEFKAILERINKTKNYRSEDDNIMWARMFKDFNGVQTDAMAKYLGMEIPQAAQKTEAALSEVQQQQASLFETLGGQITFFDGMLDDVNRVDAEVDELQDSIKEIGVLDGQLSLFDDVQSHPVAQQNAEPTEQNGTIISAEIRQLGLLQDKLGEVTAAIQAKNKAFYDEGTIVGQVVGKEISALKHLYDLLSDIRDVIDNINLKEINIPTNNLDNINTLFQDKLPDIPSFDVSSEINQLIALQGKLAEVKNAVIAKTKAFNDEGTVVGQAVGKEIAALTKLDAIVNNITPKVNSLIANLKTIGNKDIGGIKSDDEVDNTSDTKSPDEQLKIDKSHQKASITKYIDSIKDVDYVVEETIDSLKELYDNIDNVSTPDGLDKIRVAFENIKKEVAAEKNIFESTNLDYIKKAETQLRGSFNSLNLGQKQDLRDDYEEAIKKLAEYKANVQAGKKVELDALDTITAAIQQKIKAYQQANKEAEKAQKQADKNKTFGSTVETNATLKHDALTNKAKSKEFANSQVVKVALDQYEQSYQRLLKAREKLASLDNVTDEQKADFKELTKECNTYANALNKIFANSQKLWANDFDNNPYELGADFTDDRSGRQAALTDFINQLNNVDEATVRFDKNFTKCMYTVDNGDGTFTKMTATFDQARTRIVQLAGESAKATTGIAKLWDMFKGKLASIGTYLAASLGFQEVWQQIRKGIEYVREIDLALTELKKVTDETDASYNRFLQDMSKTGSVIGATVADLTTMAAEWARLGYSMEEAGKLAKSTAILLNVSEFEDATKASEALISTMQAFSYTADQSQHVVDILNEVGNNYAVSSDGIAIALQDSASALMEGGNNLEQATALVAAANRVVQDPNSVGSALRTISLRLRGTSVEILEEMGEETDGVVESISKMQEKIKALTGVDILTDSGAYKDTYTILREIGQVWEDMSDIDQAAALELMAGKNRANTLSAILSNMEDLEGAYESAMNAEGSALKENAAYLDSIQGKIDLFTNALQTFWMNFIDSSTIKGIVDLGTSLIKTLDTVHGKMLAVVGALMIYKKLHDKTKFVDMFKGAIEVLTNLVSGIKTATGATVAETIARKTNNEELLQELLTKAGLIGVTGDLTKEQIKTTAATLSEAFANGKLTASQYLATMSSMGLKTALQGLWNVLKSNPMIVISAVVTAAALAFDHFNTTAHEAAETAKDAFDEIKGVVDTTKSAIQELESELETLQDKIDELNGRNLSFAEDQELEKLKKQREELEHSLKVQEQLLELQSAASHKQAIASMKAYTKAASEGAEKTQETAKTWGTIGGIIGGALLTLGGLALIPVSGGTSSALSAMGVSTVATAVGVGAAAGGVAGNKIGEAAGSSIAANDGTYDSWYETYTKALETASKEEQKALEKYQQDSDDIDKLDKWQEAKQKTSEIKTEMYDNLSQMQSYYSDLEYGISDEIDKELDTWYNFLDKLSIDQGANGAEVTALDRIFGENASDEIKSIKEQIVDTIASGKDFDFNSAINDCKELNGILEYVGLNAGDVKDYFTMIGDSIGDINSDNIIPVQLYSDLIADAESYKEILLQTSEIVVDNTKVTQEYKDSLKQLGISEADLNKYFDKNNKLIVKDAKGLNNLVKSTKKNISANASLAKSQARLQYYQLFKKMQSYISAEGKLVEGKKKEILALYEEMNALEKTIAKYSRLETQLLDATNAYDKFEAAQEIDSETDYISSVEGWVAALGEAFNTAELGTETAQAAIAGLVPESVYEDLDTVDEKMAAIYDYFKDGKLAQYFNITFDDEGNIENAEMKLGNMRKFIEDGLVNGAFTGTDWMHFDLSDDIDNLDEFADQMGVTKEIAFAFIETLEDHDIEWLNGDYSSMFEDLLPDTLANDIYDNISAISELAVQLANGEITAEEYTEQWDKLNQVSQENAQRARENASAWIEANDDVEKAKIRVQELADELNTLYQQGASEAEIKVKTDELEQAKQLLIGSVDKLSQLETMDPIVLQLALDQAQAEINAFEKENDTLLAKVEIIQDAETEEYKYTVKPNIELTEDEKKKLEGYLEDVNAKFTYENELGEEVEPYDDQLQSIEGILQGIYDLINSRQTDNSNVNTTDIVSETDTNEDGISKLEFVATNWNSFIQTISEKWNQIWGVIGSKFNELKDKLTNFFTVTIPEKWNSFWDSVGDKADELKEKASILKDKITTFFTETIPEKWNAFWDTAKEKFDEVKAQADILKGKIVSFFTETIPEKWNQFWDAVGSEFDELKEKASILKDKAVNFFTVTIPEKWDQFWNAVESFLFEIIPYTIGYSVGAISRFFTEIIPQKWDEFWDFVATKFDELKENASILKDKIVDFFTKTIPEKWSEFWNAVQSGFENMKAKAAELKDKAINFFTQTIPQKWNEFWDAVGAEIDVIKEKAAILKDKVVNFFMVTIPEKWNAFWDAVGSKFEELKEQATILKEKLVTFFNEKILTKWNEFWDAVGTKFDEIKEQAEILKNKIVDFFTVTIPEKWNEFWDKVGDFVTETIPTAIETVKTGIITFFTVTLPEKINGLWSGITGWITEQISSFWNNLTSGFKAGKEGAEYNPGSDGAAGASGTAHARGNAYKSGDWGLPKSEHDALVGELGTEMVVDPHTGRYYTVGDNGAEMVDLPKDAIIFNHRQTEELLKNGHINSRGKAYAEGNAHVTIWPNGSSTTQWDDTGYSSWDDPTYELSEALDSAADSVGEFEETIDWIAIRMEEHDEKIGLLSAELENANTYIDKNAKIDEIISANNKKLRDLNKAYNYYSTHAEQYLEGMDSVLADAARNGEIAITEFTKEQDEATVNAINNYREFSKLAAEAYQEMEEIRSQIKDLDRQQFDNILNSVNLKTDIEDAQTGMLQDRVDLIETKGEPVPAEYYIGMKENSNQKLKYLTDARSKLDQDIVDKIANVEGFYGSDDYYEMLADLYAIQGEIDAATLELEEFQNAINDIYWDNFDELINRLDYLRNETESLIELMSHDDMFITPEGETYEGGTVEFWRPEDVAWTNEGIATMGLYAQQMEIAEYTSKQYAEAINNLTAQYNAGLISESEYLAQLDELKKKQYESIEAYHEAKDAIVDLVKARVDAIKDGIKAEIDAYSELIEKQKEALESEKDLYDFEKSIQESEKNISEIRRKLAALENDDSMAAAAERKQLEAELAEAEYELEEKYLDRSYEDKEEALDNEFEDFEEEKNAEIQKWEEYLENVELILTDSLNLVQANATGVYDTLQTKADEYGITLNDTVLMPWQNAELAIGDYSLAFDDTVSSNLEQLELLKKAWEGVIAMMSAAAGGYANDVSSGGYWSSSASDGVGTYDDAPTGPTVTLDDTPSEDPVGNDTPSSSTTISNGDTVTVDPNAKNFSRDGGNGTKMASFVPGSSYTVYGTSGNEVLIGKDGVYTGWVNKDDLVGHATGTTGVKDDELAWIDELGEELVLHADGSGRLSYLTKGTAVIPHDISENLMQLGQLDPSDVLARNTPQIGVSPSVVNNTVELNMSIAEVVHIDEVTKDTIPDLTKAIEKQLDKYMKQLNGQIRKYSR